MTMTKRDYDMIARCIGSVRANTSDDNIIRILAIDDLSLKLILEMKFDNPRFNEVSFWTRVEYWRKLHAGG